MAVKKGKQGIKSDVKTGVGSTQKGHDFPKGRPKPFSRAIPKSTKGKADHGDIVNSRVIPMNQIGVSDECG